MPRPAKTPKSEDQVIKLSLGWVVLLVITMVGLGALGGLLGTQVFQPPRTPLLQQRDALVNTVQEVTISPNTAAAEVVRRAQRSVLLLAPASTAAPISTLVTLTNDGLLAAIGPPTSDTMIALDYDGRPIPLNYVGLDALFNIAYYRAPDSVLVPLDILPDNPSVGQSLLALSRNQASLEPRADAYQLAEYVPPSDFAPDGYQILMRGTVSNAAHAVGSPLIGDDGRIAGIIINSETGTALPASVIRASFERLTRNERERNPAFELGFSSTFAYRQTADGPRTFVAEVTAVTANTPAARAGLRRGDLITQVTDTPVTPATSLINQLSANLPLTLTIERAGQESTITLQPSPTQSPVL